MVHQVPTDTPTNCRASFGSSQPSPSPSSYPVSPSVSSSPRRQPLTTSSSQTCLHWWHSSLWLQWLACTVRSYRPCSTWTWPPLTNLFPRTSSKNGRIAISESNLASSSSSGLVSGRSSSRFWRSIRACSIGFRRGICMPGGQWSFLLR